MQIITCHVTHFSLNIIISRLVSPLRHFFFSKRGIIRVPAIAETAHEAVSNVWRLITEHFCFADTFIKNNFNHIGDK